METTRNLAFLFSENGKSSIFGKFSFQCSVFSFEPFQHFRNQHTIGPGINGAVFGTVFFGTVFFGTVFLF